MAQHWASGLSFVTNLLHHNLVLTFGLNPDCLPPLLWLLSHPVATPTVPICSSGCGSCLTRRPGHVTRRQVARLALPRSPTTQAPQRTAIARRKIASSIGDHQRAISHYTAARGSGLLVSFQCRPHVPHGRRRTCRAVTRRRPMRGPDFVGVARHIDQRDMTAPSLSRCDHPLGHLALACGQSVHRWTGRLFGHWLLGAKFAFTSNELKSSVVLAF